MVKLSIITINYNNAWGLQKTIDSVLSQSFSNFEWIVIDGGSTDGSKELIEHHANYFTFWCSEPDSGIYNAINKGILHASGEYIQFLNSGDWLYSPNILSRVFARNYLSDVLYGNMIQVNGKKQQEVCYPDDLFLFFFLYDSLCHQACFYKRTVFNNNLYDESFRIVSDWAMNIKLILEGKHYEHLNFPIVFYDNNGISSGSGNNKMIEERNAAFEKYMPIHLKNDVKLYNQNYYFSRHRKTLRILMDANIRLCQRLDSILKQIENFRNK